MNELVQIIMQKTGLPQDKAQEIVDTVVNHLKGRLPEELTSHLNAFLGSGGDGSSASGFASEAGSITSGLSGMFGQKA